MTKELLMTPKAISDRERYRKVAAKNRAEGKIAHAPVGRTLLNTQKAVYDRAAYHRKKAERQRRERTIATDVVDTAPAKSEPLYALSSPVRIDVPDVDLDKLTRKELKKIILEKAFIPIPLKIREEWDPNVTRILHTDLAKFLAQKQDLEAAFVKIEELKAQQSTDLAIIHERNVALEQLNSRIKADDAEITLLKSEIQTARRQRDDSNTHSKNLNDALDRRNEENSRISAIVIERGKKISDLDETNGKLAQSVIRWKSAFLTTLFIVAVPAVITASAAVYLITHR